MGGTSPTQTSPTRTPRKALQERSDSQANTFAAIRLVPYTPERLENQREDDIYSRNPLPTNALQVFPPSSSAFYSEKQGYALRSEDDVSHQPSPSKAQSSPGSGASHSSTPTQSDHASPTSRPRPVVKKRSKHVAVDPQTKTFKVLDVAQQEPVKISEPTRLRSPPASLRSQPSYDQFPPSSSHDTEDATGSSISNHPDSSAPTSPTTTVTPRAKSPVFGDPIANSPWNYQLVGGLRKVPKTPDLKQKSVESPEPTLPPLPEVDELSKQQQELTTKPSFQSTITTTSSASDNTNYKVYGNSSPSPYPSIPPPSSSDSNYHPGHASPASSEVALPESNYEVYGDPSPSTSYVALVPSGRANYSQESLIVPPLQPWVKRPTEKFGYYKSRSRETLRTGSLTSISTVLSQEAARAIVANGHIINLPGPTPSGAWEDSAAISAARAHMQAHPHQWSSQLSTVPSESDGATDRGSRSWSDNNTRRSSGVPSPHGRHLSSSFAHYPESQGHSRSGSLERPMPAFARGQRDATGSTIRMVEDQDEHGDGITDMPEMLRSRPSRTRLSGFYSITSLDTGRTNTMQSTSSSRANSLLASSIPAWAKLYYGSGERRYLGAPGSSTEDSGSSRPASSFRSGSPDTANFPLSIYSPRRRPREINPNARHPSISGSMDINPIPELGSDGNLIYNHRYVRRVRTSSIWSPHLRHDRRAPRTSVWDPPSVNWSTGSGFFGRRNIQIVMFSVGFIFPFAWMIAAFLPLPPNHMQSMRQRYDSESQIDVSNEVKRQFGPIDESRHESARWWRNLNRGMSVVGILIIALVIVLAVVGVLEGWGFR